MPNPYEVQLEGMMEFAPVVAGVVGAYVDYSAELAGCVLGRSRNTVDRKPTYAKATTEKRAADLVETLTVNHLGDEGNITGFWHLVWTALKTPPCDLAFKLVYKPGAVSASNPMFVGRVTVVESDAGAPAGETKWVSKTWPAYDVDGPLAADPDE